MPAPQGVDQAKWDRCVLQVKKSGKGVNASAVCSAALKKDKTLSDKSIAEAISGLSNGAIQRAGAKKECKEALTTLQEIQVTEDGRQYFPVTIIAEGLGNLRDKNFYSAEAIQSGPMVYEGKQAYYDHPTAKSEKENPNRTINELLGHYEDVKAVKTSLGIWELQGKLYTIPGMSRSDIREALQHSVEYKKKYPDKDFVGISINGSGEGETMDWQDFVNKYSPAQCLMEKLKQIKGQKINVITRLTDAFSADVVTAPGAGGKINTVEQTRRDKMKFLEQMKKFFSAVESGDEAAAKNAMTELVEQDANTVTQESKLEEASKKMAAMMKKEKKKEDESEEEYESRLAKMLKKEMAEAIEAKKEDDDGDDDDKKAAKKKKDADEAAAVEAKKKSDDEEAKKKADKKKESEDLSARITELETSLKKLTESLEKTLVESAQAKTELSIKKREEMIDSKLAECGYRREITKLWKPLLDTCKTEKDMDEKLKLMKEAAAKASAENFYDFGSRGLSEKQESGSGKNDDLFL